MDVDPATLAELDQENAAINANIDQMVAGVRKCLAAGMSIHEVIIGQAQINLMTSDNDASSISMYLSAALVRLAQN